jgi:hypothetical protein
MVGLVKTPLAKAGGFGLRQKGESICHPADYLPLPQGVPEGHKRAGKQESFQQTLLLDSYPLFLGNCFWVA